METPVWVGGSAAIMCVAVVDRLLVPLEGGWRIPVALAFVWATVALAVAPLRAGKRVPPAGAAAQVALLGFFTLTVALYAARHGVHAPSFGDLAPRGRCSPSSPPCWSTTSSASSCRRRPGRSCADPARDVPASTVRAGALTCALYAVPVLAIVLVVPADRLTGLTGFIDALAAVFVVYGPWEGLAATVTTLAAFAVAGDDNSRYFSVALTLSISLLALAAALWPGLGVANPDAHLPDGFAGQRLAFTVAELVPLGLVLLAAFLLARTRRQPGR